MIPKPTQSIFRLIIVLIVGILGSIGPVPQSSNVALAQDVLHANIVGQVTDKRSGREVVGARVEVPALGLSTTSDNSGQFAWDQVPLTTAYFPTTLTVTAPGYGAWTLQDVRLVANDTLILTVELSATPTTIIVPPPRAEIPRWPEELLDEALMEVTEDQTSLPLPLSIRVRVTGYAYCDLERPYTVETIDFKEYAKHVLPNEWSPAWLQESLRAGAMAVKMYAWSYIAEGGKWPDADVYDSTCDQVYNPAVEYESTNDAIDFTWNWRLMRDDQLVRTFYRYAHSQCPSDLIGNCMGQVDSRDMAENGYTWDEILVYFYSDSTLSEIDPSPRGYSLRYYGMYNDDENRVKIPIDDPTNDDPGPPADVGAENFTIEWWMRSFADENTADEVECGVNQSWRQGNILLDRDRFNQNRKFGISLADGKLVFGVTGDGTGDLTLCGTTDLTDGRWHHVAVQRRRSDGWMWIFVDGTLETQTDGPDGDVSYPDDGIPGSFCGSDGSQPCTDSDPYIVLGAEKHGIGPEYPSYSGWIDELRMSNTLRYSSDFVVPENAFTPDGNTVALYHFDEGIGNAINDTSGYSGVPSHGFRVYGGVINGPEWSIENPFGPTFIDVGFEHWAHDEIEAIYQFGITGGCQREPLQYCPGSKVTRAQMAIFLMRGIEGTDYMPPPATGIFADVDPGHWTAPWIESFYGKGITSGCGTDPLRYCPNYHLTRTQMAIFLERVLHGSDYEPPPAIGIFDDVDPGHWTAPWIEALYADGVTLGCSADPLLYCPDGLVSRAEMAVFLARVFDLPTP